MQFPNFWAPLRALLRRTFACLSSPCSRLRVALPRIFVVVEGQNDIEFLRRISTILHAAEPQLPDLGLMEQRRELLFVPSGGGDSRSWAYRLAGLGCAEFHLFDRDVPPVTEIRQQVAEIVNGRPRCRAVLTRLRALENYLHPRAIFEVSGLQIAFSGEDNLAELIARQIHERQERRLPWDALRRAPGSGGATKPRFGSTRVPSNG